MKNIVPQLEIPRGFGVRQSAGGLAAQGARLKSGRGLPQSKTPSRVCQQFSET